VPFPLLAHQAPVLALKLWRPRWFSTVALVAGSIAPDVDLAIWPEDGRLGHTITGQFVLCLPLSLAVTWLTARYIGPALAARIPRLRSLGTLAQPFASFAALGIAVSSALVGSFSHVLFDALTHSHRYGGLVPQLVASVLGAAVTLFIAARFFRREKREVAPATDPRPRASFLLVMLPLACASVTLLLSRTIVRQSRWYFAWGPVYVWGYVAFRASCAAFVGLAIAAFVTRILDRKTVRALQ
jgi:Domain of unknown function (DUF4184)